MGTLVTSPDRAVLLYTEYKRWSSAVTRKRFKNYKTERFFNTNCRPFFKIIWRTNWNWMQVKTRND